MINLQEYNLDDLYFDVRNFNRIAGKDTVSTKKQLLAQVKLIQEELDELREGIENDNPEEIIDGAADVAVTFFGIVSQLNNLGFNFSGAAVTTAQNNDSKFVFSKTEAEESVKALSAAEPGRGFSYKQDDVTKQWVIFDDAGKVRKPIGYVKNNLKKFVPSDYKEKIVGKIQRDS